MILYMSKLILLFDRHMSKLILLARTFEIILYIPFIRLIGWKCFTCIAPTILGTSGMNVELRLFSNLLKVKSLNSCSPSISLTSDNTIRGTAVEEPSTTREQAYDTPWTSKGEKLRLNLFCKHPHSCSPEVPSWEGRRWRDRLLPANKSVTPQKEAGQPSTRNEENLSLNAFCMNLGFGPPKYVVQVASWSSPIVSLPL